MVDAAVGHWWQELPKDVRDLTNRSDLSKQQQEKLCTLLSKWEKVFPKQDEDFRRTDLVQHRIHIRKTLLIGMVEKGIIWESCSPWASPIVLVKKKDRSWIFCAYYRKWNAVTHKDAFPLPRTEETPKTERELHLPPCLDWLNLSICPLVFAMHQQHSSVWCSSAWVAWVPIGIWMTLLSTRLTLLLTYSIWMKYFNDCGSMGWNCSWTNISSSSTRWSFSGVWWTRIG